MEMRLGHCLFIVFFEWIWIFGITSILGGTKAEVMCIPVCQLPLITAVPRDLSALDFTNLAEVSAEELDGFIEGSSGAKRTDDGDERRSDVRVTASEESSPQVPSGLEGTDASLNREDELNGQRKLPNQKEFDKSVLRAATHPLLGADLNGNGTGGEDNNSTGDENLVDGDATAKEESDAAGWRRTRSARSAETWSGFRQDVAEDVSFSEQQELQLTSSTFALTEDTAHNQAMVHWSGQNSSVSSFTHGLFFLTHCHHCPRALSWHGQLAHFLF